METFYDIPFSKLYRQHLARCHYHDLDASKWDEKAQKFAENFVEKESLYVTQFMQAVQCDAQDTVLDIGCGPGTLAIPLARRCQQVYALDFSQGMLSLLKKYQFQLQLPNIQLLHYAWHNDWQAVPQADIVIASRATLVDDLDNALDKIISKAKKRVYLTAITQPHFLDLDIFRAIGREALGFPTYIYLLNALYQRGIQAELRFIQGESGIFQGKTYQELEKAVIFSLGELNQTEKARLRQFYLQKQNLGETIQHGQTRWALISWQV